MSEWIIALALELWGHRGYRVLISLVGAEIVLITTMISVLSWQTSRRFRRNEQRQHLVKKCREFVRSGDESLVSWLKQDRAVPSTVVRDTLLELGQGECRDVAAKAWREFGFPQEEHKRLKGGSSNDRLKSIRRLYVFAEAGDREAILAALDEEQDHRFRITAAQALGRIGRGEDVVRALEGVRIVRRTMEQPFYAAFKSLSTEQLQLIVDGSLSGLSERIRSVLLEVAAERGIESVQERLGVMAEHVSTERRVATARIAAKIDTDRSREMLRTMLGDDAWQVRAQAARGLGVIGKDSAIPLLRDAEEDDAYWVRENARRALEQLHSGGRTTMDVRPKSTMLHEQPLVETSEVT